MPAESTVYQRWRRIHLGAGTNACSPSASTVRTPEHNILGRLQSDGYLPKLQSVGLVCRFLRWQRGFPIPSSAAFGKIGAAYVREVHRFAAANGIPLVHFAKGENKE